MTDPFERAVMRERLEKQERTLRHIKWGWAVHLRVYVAVNLLLFGIWWLTGGADTHPWFLYPLGGWGIGLYLHGAHTKAHVRRHEEMRRSLDE